MLEIGLFTLGLIDDLCVFPDANIFVNDGAIDYRAFANFKERALAFGGSFFTIIEVIAHHNRIQDGNVGANDCS